MNYNFGYAFRFHKLFEDKELFSKAINYHDIYFNESEFPYQLVVNLDNRENEIYKFVIILRSSIFGNYNFEYKYDFKETVEENYLKCIKMLANQIIDSVNEEKKIEEIKKNILKRL